MTPHRDRLTAGEYEPGAAAPGSDLDLDTATKAELQARAAELGLELPDSATKAELRAAIEAA